MSECCGPFVPGSGGGGGATTIDQGVALSAGSQSAATGTVLFANSNGFTFGMSASSRVTASFDGFRSMSAGTTHAIGPGVSFANGSGVTFGVSGSTITASVASQTPETPFAISAGTQSVSTGTVSFANGGGITWGMSGSNTITASIASQVPETPFGISAGTQSVSTGTVSFANSNGITWGMSGSNTITASFSDYSHSMYQPWLGNSLSMSHIGQSSVHIHPRTIPNLVFSQWNQLMSWQANVASIGTCSFSFHLGIYTKNVSTLSLLMSTSFGGTIDHSLALNDSLNSGIRLATCAWSSTLSRGDYWVAHMMRSTFSSNNGTLRPAIEHALQGAAFSGYIGVAANTSVQEVLGFGVLSVQTAALPNAIGFSDINGGAFNPPAFALGSSV